MRECVHEKKRSPIFLISLAFSVKFMIRCEFHSLLFGILTALPTGAASAIAVLGENSGPVVGVAISVSLLPPAVNAVSTAHKCAEFLIFNSMFRKNESYIFCYFCFILLFFHYHRLLFVNNKQQTHGLNTPHAGYFLGTGCSIQDK